MSETESKEPIPREKLTELGLKNAQFDRYAATLPTGSVLIYQINGLLYMHGQLVAHIDSEQELKAVLAALKFQT